MNERIQELSNQATLACMEVDPAHAVPAPNLRFNQIFAELIVKECAEVSANEFLMKVYKGPHQAHAARQAVLEHFGVE